MTVKFLQLFTTFCSIFSTQPPAGARARANNSFRKRLQTHLFHPAHQRIGVISSSGKSATAQPSTKKNVRFAFL